MNNKINNFKVKFCHKINFNAILTLMQYFVICVVNHVIKAIWLSLARFDDFRCAQTRMVNVMEIVGRFDSQSLHTARHAYPPNMSQGVALKCVTGDSQKTRKSQFLFDATQ